MFNTLAEIKAANEALRQHFFCAGAMHFFQSRVSRRIYPRPDGSAYFVTSERAPDGPRRYTVRMIEPGGNCGTAPGLNFQAFDTARAAHAWAAEFCKETNR